MTTSCTDDKHPFYKELEKLEPKEAREFFTSRIEKMKHVSLGQALDFISYGGMNYVVWEMNRKSLINFIQKWMDVQGEHYFWNRPGDNHYEQLPFINDGRCQVSSEHTGTITDLAGRVRCAHSTIERFKPSFVETFRIPDEKAIMQKVTFQDTPPDELFFEDEDYDIKTGELFPREQERLDAYEKEMQKFEDEEPTFEVLDACYSIISDKGIYLPLEKVLRRLDVSYLFARPENYCVFPFSGFTLANFVRTWHNQKGKKRFFMERGQREDFRLFKDFQPVSSED